MYVLLKCMYEGDGYLIDNIFESASEDLNLLVDLSKKMGSDFIYLPGNTVPDDGCWSDTRIRHRIIKAKKLDGIYYADEM